MEALMTIEEVSQYFNTSKHTIYRLIQREELPAVKIGNQWRFKKEDLDNWLESSAIKPNRNDSAKRADLEG